MKFEKAWGGVHIGRTWSFSEGVEVGWRGGVGPEVRGQLRLVLVNHIFGLLAANSGEPSKVINPKRAVVWLVCRMEQRRARQDGQPHRGCCHLLVPYGGSLLSSKCISH